jgi:23S rRNA (adenine2503-C2)-methyltransferase
MSQWGHPGYRVSQITQWLYQKRIREFSEMSNLSLVLRQRLAEEFYIGFLKVVRREESVDGTRKFLIQLEDEKQIESVLIRDEDRLTACISSQVGCPLGCEFCRTGKNGYERDLLGFEIAGQVLALQDELEEGEKITNLVFMGMGEPLLNLRELREALDLFLAGEGLGFSPRRVTVSTVGVVPAMREMGSWGLRVKLAVSLNAADDETRSRLMPINQRFSLSALIPACTAFPLPKGQRITFEYVMMDGVNDRIQDARTLIRLLRGLPCKINLIPFNPWAGCAFRPSSPQKVEAFQRVLLDHHYVALVRKSKGADISAACGLLTGSHPGN